MKTTVLTLLVLLLTSSINSQSNNFLLGFSSTYPNGHTYDVSQYADWGWYNELSMNTWQGF